MATTIMAEHSWKLLKVISGFRHLQISHLQRPNISWLKRTVWSGTILNGRNTESREYSKNFPPKPKMPANVFVLYLQKVENEIKKARPDVKRTEIVSQASKMWHRLDPEEKYRLSMERKDMFDKYKEEIRLYLENMTPEHIRADELLKEKAAARQLNQIRKALGMPARPLGSLSCFVAETFSKRDQGNVPIYFKNVIHEWTQMSAAEKEKYKQKSQVFKEKYLEDMEKWENEMVALGRFDVVRKSLLVKLTKGKRENSNKHKVGFSVHEDDDKEL